MRHSKFRRLLPRKTAPMVACLAPGDWVRHPTEPDWGLGQVQSVVGNRVTANFENVGKQLINAELISLTPLAGPPTRKGQEDKAT